MNSQQITEISIRGYKSIEQAEIRLGMLNVLIGSNGSGKTNFISLFRLLSAMIEGNLQTYVAKHGGPDAFLYWGRKRTEKMDIRFLFGNNGYDFSLEPTLDNRMMFAREDFLGNVHGSKVIARGNFESEWRKGTGTHIDEYIQPVLRNQRWRVYHFHDTGETALVKQIQGINDNMEFASDARNLAAFLYRLQRTERETYVQIVRTIQMAAPYFDDFILRPMPLNKDKILLEWKAKGSDIPFTAAQLSDGTLRFICLTVLLLQPEELQPDTILIDEPELGLHPYAISLLAALVKKASLGKQVILSTQSVELLNEFAAKDIIVVNQQDGASMFNHLDEEELSGWLAEDYTLGELWKRNILGGRP